MLCMCYLSLNNNPASKGHIRSLILPWGHQDPEAQLSAQGNRTNKEYLEIQIKDQLALKPMPFPLHRITLPDALREVIVQITLTSLRLRISLSSFTFSNLQVIFRVHSTLLGLSNCFHLTTLLYLTSSPPREGNNVISLHNIWSLLPQSLLLSKAFLHH